MMIMAAAFFMCTAAHAQVALEVEDGVYVYFGASDEIPIIDLGCPDTIIIADSPGGNLSGTMATLAEAFICETEFVISGECYSGCTLYLTLPPERICLTEEALFFFHGPAMDRDLYEAIYGTKATEEIVETNRIYATNYMMNVYPEWLRPWLEESGALNENSVFTGISQEGIEEISPHMDQRCKS